jgi:hypothetical protein
MVLAVVLEARILTGEIPSATIYATRVVSLLRAMLQASMALKCASSTFTRVLFTTVRAVQNIGLTRRCRADWRRHAGDSIGYARDRELVSL